MHIFLPSLWVYINEKEVVIFDFPFRLLLTNASAFLFKTKVFLVIRIQIYNLSRYKSGKLRNQQNYKYSINTINYKYQFYIYYFIFLEFNAIKLWSISPYLIITQGFLYNLLQWYVKIVFDLSNYEDILVCISKIWRNSQLIKLLWDLQVDCWRKYSCQRESLNWQFCWRI